MGSRRFYSTRLWTCEPDLPPAGLFETANVRLLLQLGGQACDLCPTAPIQVVLRLQDAVMRVLIPAGTRPEMEILDVRAWEKGKA